jgi:hypothetical protein
MKVKAGELKPGQPVWLAGMVMTFSHFDGDTPVFSHFAPATVKGKRNYTQVNYHTSQLNREALIETA